MIDPRARGGAPAAPPSSRYVLPKFEERTAYGFKRQDPYTKMFEDRVIFLGVQVDDASADDLRHVLDTATPPVRETTTPRTEEA